MMGGKYDEPLLAWDFVKFMGYRTSMAGAEGASALNRSIGGSRCLFLRCESSVGTGTSLNGIAGCLEPVLFTVVKLMGDVWMSRSEITLHDMPVLHTSPHIPSSENTAEENK